MESQLGEKASLDEQRGASRLRCGKSGEGRGLGSASAGRKDINQTIIIMNAVGRPKYRVPTRARAYINSFMTGKGFIMLI